jgi:hypothetical protein
MRLTAEELLAGSKLEQTVTIPPTLLGRTAGQAGGEVTLRPLTLRDVQLVLRAAKDERVLTSVLMVQQALVEPKLSLEQVSQLPAGVVQFLLERVNSLSGLDLGKDELEQAVKAPIARACFLLSRHFGWTPAECSDLTVGQVLLYVEMLGRDHTGEGTP